MFHCTVHSARPISQSFNPSRFLFSKLPLVLFLVILPVAAYAQGSPFDTGFTSLQTLFTGTVPKVASLIAIVIGGYGLAHGAKATNPMRTNSTHSIRAHDPYARSQVRARRLSPNFIRIEIQARCRGLLLRSVGSWDNSSGFAGRSLLQVRLHHANDFVSC